MSKMCPNCGSYVNGNPNHCTNCGIKFVQKNVEEVVVIDNSDKTNGLAITGFVLSLVNLLLCCGCLFVPALIFSIMGMVMAKNNKEGGTGLALAGIIITCVSILLLIILAFIGELFYWMELFYYL